MAIFNKRPLFTACILYLLFAVIGYFAPPAIKIVTLVFALIVAFSFAILKFAFKKVGAYTALCVIMSSLMVALSLFSSYRYFNVYADSIEKYHNETHTIEALVTSNRTYDANYSTYNVTVRRIDGKATDHKAILNCTYASELEPGFLIIANVSAEDFDSDITKMSMHSDGIFIQYTSADDASVLVTDEDDLHPLVMLSELNTRLSRVFRAKLDENTAEICAAMLLGNKNRLGNVVERDFSRAGASHLLALSGLHVSIIMGMLMLLLKKLRVPTKAIALILIAGSIFYLLLTGVKISAARSVIMVLLVYLSLLSSRQHDSLTSLSFAGAMIMLISPCSVLDAGFWMSFGATLGILIYVPFFNDLIGTLTGKLGNKAKLLKPVTTVVSALIAGVFALIPLIIVLFVFIKQISLASVLSSAVLAIPAYLIILFSLLFLVFSKIPFIAFVIAKVLSFSARFMTGYCAEISKAENIVVSLNYPFATIATIALCAAFAYSMIKKSKNMFRSLIPFALTLIFFVGAMCVYNYSEKDTVSVYYANAASTSDMLVISSNGESIICDIGSGSNNSYYSISDAVSEARSTEIRAIILSRYTRRHVSSLYNVFTNRKVKELWIPYPSNDDDYYKMVRIVEYAERYGVAIRVYRDGETLCIFEDTHITLRSYKIDRSVTAISLVSIDTPKERLVYCSPAFNETEEESIEEINGILADADYIIFGNKGPKTKTDYSIPSDNKATLIAFSDETRAAYYKESSERPISYSLVTDHCKFCLND
ncbi:MAG: ComEC/Rec2 family competence protein [Clostridia bacterium]|nr:ComEC/Rec2 family competence protein [Clostridia bacterium]